MNILVVNAGSTSYKCRLYSMPDETELARGSIDRIGGSDAELSYYRGGQPVIVKERREIKTHADAVRIIIRMLSSPQTGAIKNINEIDAVGFKTVQAGEKNGTVLLGEDVLDAMERYAPLAPAHNPPYLACIRFFKEQLPSTPLVGVFEPGFHSNIPEYARIFGTPYDWYADHGIAKYGYHGATFRYVQTRLAAYGFGESRRIIACHLGGSSSICAIKDGHSIDVSMNFTPQSGLLQSGRTGDIDPFVLPFIMERKGISLDAALKELSSNGGLKGISGIGADMRDIQNAAASGNKRAQLAIEKFVYDVVRYIGSFHVLLGGVDVIAFSGGIGFYNDVFRKMIIDRIAFLGIELEKEDAGGKEGRITKESSPIAVVVIDTNEEIVISRETARLLAQL
jgi:acetate kinase